MNLSNDQVLRFQKDGFLVVEQIISDTQIHDILKAMDRVYGGIYTRDIRAAGYRKYVEPHTKSDSSIRWILHSRLLDDSIWKFATDRELGRVAAQLLATDSVLIMEDQLLDKPGPGAPVALHQDYTYWRFCTRCNIVSCWFALTDMTAEMGPVEAVPGSHKWGVVESTRKFVNANNQEYETAASGMMPSGMRFRAEPAVVKKGGGIFFHGLTLHGSRENSTNECRRAITLHWASADCTYDSSRMLEYGFPQLFIGLKDGSKLMNKYMPRVFP